MTGIEAQLANAASIEMYGHTLVSKGLHARAQWAFIEARKIRMAALMWSVASTDAPETAAAA